MTNNSTPGVRGMRSEAAVAAALVRSGAQVFLPAFGSIGRIDLVYERGNRLTRVQCKTACLVGQALRFWTCAYTDRSATPYHEQVDEFGVYSPDTEAVYLVPISEVPSRACFLRVSPAKNGQQQGVRWANDFLLGPP